VDAGGVLAAGVVTFLITAVILGRFAAVFQTRAAKRRAERGAAFRTRVQSEFKCDELMISAGVPIKCIGVRFADQKIILGLERNGFFVTHDFRRVTAVEIVENGQTVTNTNRSSQFIGAAVGDLLLGGVGAIVGGLSGSTRSTSNVKSLHLKITVDDQTNPVWLICFFVDSSQNGSPPGSSVLATRLLFC